MQLQLLMLGDGGKYSWTLLMLLLLMLLWIHIQSSCFYFFLLKLTWGSLSHPDIAKLTEFAKGLFNISFRRSRFQVTDINLALGGPAAVS